MVKIRKVGPPATGVHPLLGGVKIDETYTVTAAVGEACCEAKEFVPLTAEDAAVIERVRAERVARMEAERDAGETKAASQRDAEARSSEVAEEATPGPEVEESPIPRRPQAPGV